MITRDGFGVSTLVARFHGLGLLGLGLAACAGSSDGRSSTNLLVPYGVHWSGVIQSPPGDTLLVEACSNDACRTLVVPIAGLAPESSWDPYRPPDPPDGGSSTPRPTSLPWTAPEAGQCRTLHGPDGDVGIAGCAATAGADTSDVTLQVSLDLTGVRTTLRTGDEASLRVKDAVSEATLLEYVTTIDADAPYYVSIDLDTHEVR